MSIITVTDSKLRRTVDRYVRTPCANKFDVDPFEFDDRYLQRRMETRIFGKLVWFWWVDVRVVPVHEWVRCAFGENFTFEDEYPAARFNR
jgi:hypothetical protein